jgi:hypothetical protein
VNVAFSTSLAPYEKSQVFGFWGDYFRKEEI